MSTPVTNFPPHKTTATIEQLTKLVKSKSFAKVKSLLSKNKDSALELLTSALQSCTPLERGVLLVNLNINPHHNYDVYDLVGAEVSTSMLRKFEEKEE